ncbi:Crp/Fnr family transcriptional regulator [Bosea caraganae]|uniref:Crp/Fnr family transcriptional regulator n=1 Tax=Bosea caraganae TaxID=2763117 RepID=A0A370L7K8_9HYPH|nr:Crp/Fnr family transcriptional regulator [Bosea caraganae]RDJ25041.1 Crp/Fnr family transcriptional regulator [Bosea caraganae]RDJ26151.1 Crp/Fnr family transcriptional regulator [Bosea caraganae]
MNDLSQTPRPAAQFIDFRQLARGLGTVINYAAGDIVFREGDQPAYAYIVLTGEVEVSSHGKLIEQVSEGRAFGIVSLIDKKPRSATAKAIEVSEIALVDSKQFRYMVETTPNFVWYVLGEVVDRLRATNSAL